MAVGACTLQGQWPSRRGLAISAGIADEEKGGGDARQAAGVLARSVRAIVSSLG
jgi:hypothetical protein